MSRDWKSRPDGDDQEGRDMEVASLLKVVDPASADPHYWLRFQSWVLKNAAPELARRRLMAELTMGDVVVGWARAVVPTALVAAVVAALVLASPWQARDTLASTASVEDLLVAGMEEATIPATLVNDDDAAAPLNFAAETF